MHLRALWHIKFLEPIISCLFNLKFDTFIVQKLDDLSSARHNHETESRSMLYYGTWCWWLGNLIQTSLKRQVNLGPVAKFRCTAWLGRPWAVAPGAWFCGQILRIKCISCVGTHLWITMAAKSTLSIWKIYWCEYK